MTASRYDLLPPNATTLERNLSRVTSSLVRAGAPVPTIRTAKRTDIPDSVVPWLVFEYGLAEILPYLSNQREASEGGVQWQRIRGTPAAILQGLGWLNLNGEIDESEGGSYRWAEFQIGIDAPTSGEAIISQITAVARLSAPVRSRLQRIYSVYDFRRFLLDDSLLSDGAILSDHSGVRPRPDWPQISFGDYRSSSVSADFTVISGDLSVIGIQVVNSNCFILDHSLIDEGWHVLNGDGVRTDYLPTTASRFDASTNWSDQLAWGDFTWEGVGYLVSSKITTTT
jgi:P2-related tail formation protein